MKTTCPHCGNTDRRTIESNGLRPSDPDYTLLCVALVPARDASIKPDADQIDASGRSKCGMQWEPAS